MRSRVERGNERRIDTRKEDEDGRKALARAGEGNYLSLSLALSSLFATRASYWNSTGASSIARINLTSASVSGAAAHGRQIRFQGPREKRDCRACRGSTEPTAIPVSKDRPDYR